VLGLIAQGQWAGVPGAVSGIWQAQQQTNFTVRAQAIAGEIASAKPDVIGLQEVSQWVVIPPSGPQNAQVTDFLAILTADLAQRGLHYMPAVVTANFTATLPDAQGDYIQLTDRNVILVNQDARGLQVTSSSDGHFAAQFTVGQGALGFNENCSWQEVDFTRGGRIFRYVNTHLTSVSPVIQQMQAAELLAGPGATNMPVIFGGDYNTDAYQGAYGGPDATGTYPQLAGSGLKDAWAATHNQHQLGLTWGQNAQLNNLTSTVSERIDFFFTQGAVKARQMQVIGNKPIGGGTQPNWASDHAGIVATFQLTANKLHVHQVARGHGGCTVPATNLLTALERR
jgi:endonuclease/exonuclease/phosphatase family metal-dependent hydrolase